MTLRMLGSARPERWLVADPGDTWQRARVIAVERGVAATILRLHLVDVPRILAGQYYLLRLAIETPPGVVEQAYSVCSSPFPPTVDVEIAVREVPGGRASPILARQVEVGDLLQVRGPYGSLTWTEQDGGPLGLVGAGSGVAPLASIVRYGASRRLTVPMTLLSSSPDRAAILFAQQLQVLSREEKWFRVVHTFTRSLQDGSASYHRRIDADMLGEAMGTARRDHFAPKAFYVAGPGGFVLSVRAALLALGVPDAAIHSEDHA